MPRYFYSELAARPFTNGNTTVSFEKTAIVGSNICGIYQTEDPSELAVLDAAVANRVGVIEISAEDYEQHRAQKKTTPNSPQSSTLRPVHQLLPPQMSRVSEQQGVASVERSEEPKSYDGSTKIEDPKSVVKLDKVASPGFVSEGERLAPIEKKKSKARN